MIKNQIENDIGTTEIVILEELFALEIISNKDNLIAIKIDDNSFKTIKIGSTDTLNINLSDDSDEYFNITGCYFDGCLLSWNSKITKDTIDIKKFTGSYASGYKYDGYVAQITDLKSYFDENMRLLNEENRNALFRKGNFVYTKVRDDNPTRYINGAKAKNVMVADGCVIEGEIENSILARGVVVKKGAKVKNCILMQDTVVEEGANIEYVITDKNVHVSANKSLTGNDSILR